MKLLPIFEAAIAPMDFDGYFKTLEKTSITTIDDLNSISPKIQYITQKQFKKMNKVATLPSNFKSAIIHNNGIGAGTVYNGIIYIICDPKLLIKSLNSPIKEHLIKMLRLIVRHESIHIQQIDRSGGKVKDVDKAETPEEFKEYMGNKQEIMAYAQSIVDSLRMQNLSDNQILQQLRQGRIWDNSMRTYRYLFKDEPKVLNLLQKYIYQYLKNDPKD
jgi:hypothetical protein